MELGALKLHESEFVSFDLVWMLKDFVGLFLIWSSPAPDAILSQDHTMPPPSRNNKRSPESPPTNDVGWKWWRKEEGEWKNDWKWEEEWGDPGWDKNYGWREQDALEGPDHEGKEDEDDDVQVVELKKEPIEVESDGEADDEPHPKKDHHDEPTEDDTWPLNGDDEGTEDETWGDWKPLPGAKPASGSGDVSNGPEWLESLDEYPSWGGWIMSGLVDKKHVCF